MNSAAYFVTHVLLMSEMDVCDFKQIYECLEIPRRTHCFFSLMTGDFPFPSLIVVVDLLLER